MTKLRIISDIHGKSWLHENLTEGAEYSIQIGDLGFDYTYLKNIDPDHHKFFCGNHDQHHTCAKWPHWLGSYGQLNGSMFYVGGGFSIDWKYRTPGFDYFPNEELSELDLECAFELYRAHLPQVMLSHEAPRSIIHHFTDGNILKNFGYDPETFTTRTSEALEKMLSIHYHKPKLWVFGHYHRKWEADIDGCHFVCLPVGGYIDIEVDL